MNDVEKREKVMLGLECCAKVMKCTECPYSVFTDVDGNGYCRVDNMISDALALLKEQEARVMTYEEIKDNLGVPVWVEYTDNENWNGYGVPTSDHKAYIMIYGANAYCAHNARSHNVKWRCWTSRPTPDQMRDTKWEDKAE